MSDHILRGFHGPAGARVLALVLVLAGCSDAEKPAADATLPPEPVKIERLTDAELMGIPRNEVVLTLPWGGNTASRDPAPPRATLRSVKISGGAGFDRAVFEFGTDTPFPGYRIVWNEAAASVCAEEGAPDLGPERVLLIQFKPSTAREDSGRPTVAQSSRLPGLLAVATARQLCDDNDHLVWALGSSDCTAIRIVELRRPPRLLVDVRHQVPQSQLAPEPTGG